MVSELLKDVSLDGLTTDDLWEISRRVDSLLIGAESLPELYRKLNTLHTNGSKEWKPLRAPMWVGNRLVIVVWKPSRD